MAWPDPLCTRVGTQYGSGLKVVHDVARKAARHGHDAGDKEQLDLCELREGCHDEHDDEAKDLHRSIPVWPQLCALMMVVTKVNSVTMTAGTGPRSSAMATITAMAAVPRPMMPARA